MNPQDILSRPTVATESTTPVEAVQKSICTAPVHKMAVLNVPGKGRGVFAQTAFMAGDIIEVCPVIVLSSSDSAIAEQTHLRSFSFDWPESYGTERAYPMGYGMIYNHSYAPNIRYTRNPAKKTIIFTALRDIRPGEELCSNYNGDPASTKSLFPAMPHFQII